MTISNLFSKSILYYGWFSVSTITLFASYFIEPYLFAYMVFITIGLSLVLFVISLFIGRRSILLALACFIPPMIAYSIMTTFNWA